MKTRYEGRTLHILKSLFFTTLIIMLSAILAFGQAKDQRSRDDDRKQSLLRKLIEQKTNAGRSVSIAASETKKKSSKSRAQPAGINTLDLKFLFMFGKNDGLQGIGFGDGEFIEPAGIAVNSLEEVFVVDTSNDRVQVFDTDGNYLRQFGTFGTGSGEFDEPFGIAIDSGDNVYVVDTGNARVQKFDSNGTFIREWGAFGVADGEFIDPFGVAVDSNDDVYVADFTLDRVQKFDSDGNFILKWGTPGSADGSFTGAIDIDVDSGNILYVTDYGNDRVQKFDTAGNFVGKWDSDFPVGIAVDGNDDVYVAQFDIPNIQKTDSDGALIFNFGVFGTENGEFDLPQFVGIDGSNNVFISEDFNSRVQKFDSDGNFLLKFGANGGVGPSDGDGDGEFNFTGDVEIDANGNIFVTDIINDRVQKFDSNGNYLDQFGSFGFGPGEFQLPTGIAFDGNGNIYVVDQGNDRVQKFSSDFTFLTEWGSSGPGDGEFDVPVGIAIDVNDRVFVADSENHRVQVFDVDGNFLFSVGSFGAADGEMEEPHDIAFDSANNFYVAEEGNERISKFDSAGNFILKWGTDGDGDGQFRDAWGITIDGDDNVYVIDETRSIMQKFDTSGTFLGKLGGFGFDEGEFLQPEGIATDSRGYVYVSDTLNNRVQVFGPTGSLQVTIDPAGANAAGAQWRVDGGSWRDSGDTATDLLIGDYTVEFQSITGWITPADQSVTITAGETTITSGTYIELGHLQVTIEPAGAVAGGAQWRVDGGSWRDSGDTASNLSLGSHTVEFSSITGYTKPGDQNVTINSGETTITSGTYSIIFYTISGTVKMDTTPLEGVDVNFSHDGSTVVTDASGNYSKSVSFGTTTTITPSKTHYQFTPATSQVTSIAADTTVDFAASFIFYNIHGTIKEGNTPVEGVKVHFSHDGDTVRTDANGEYSKRIKSGTTTTVTPSKTNYSFSPEDVEITSIGKNTQVDFEATFNAGSVKVLAMQTTNSVNSGFFKMPEGGGWRIVGYGSGDWMDFGDSLSRVPIGEYTIEFRHVPGFITPDDIKITVELGKVTSFSASYVCPFTSQSSDYNGDGMNDLAVYDPETNTWRIGGINSNAGTVPSVTEILVRKFGVDGSTPAPGDYDGDGTTDLAYWVAATGVWRVDKQFRLTGFGEDGDVPVPANYIGDDRADPALYRPSEGLWLIYDRDAKSVIEFKFGGDFDIPVPGDYNGDGITDIGVWNSESGEWRIAVYKSAKGTWKINRKLGGALGGPGYVPVQADYDGDGATDLAVYRLSDSVWKIARQPDVELGNSFSIPLAIDWNGDGSAQITIFGIVKGQWRSDNLREIFGKGMRPISGTN